MRSLWQGLILGLHWGYIRVILGLYRDNGKENGDYSIIGRVYIYRAKGLG